MLTLSPAGSVDVFANAPCEPDGLAVDPGRRVFIGCGGVDEVYELTIPTGAATPVVEVDMNGQWAPSGCSSTATAP